MRIIAILLIAFTSLFFTTQQRKIRVHTLGDSTMEQQNPNAKEQRGWPQLLQPFFTDEVEVIDPAKSGTSTKTYYRGGYWDRAKKAIRPGDYVFIQFGHNDEKHGGIDGEIGTAATDSFRIYLTKYVNEVRAMGGIPVLFTPVVRKMFGPDGRVNRRGRHDLGEGVREKINPTFDVRDTVTYNYPYNMKVVAKLLNCPLIDMTELTRHLVDSLGQAKATGLIYNLTDGTHFGESGALLFSRLAARELRRQGILASYIKPDPKLIVAPSSISFGNMYAGTSPTQILDVCYLGSKSVNAKINLSATEGFSLSATSDGSFSQTLEIPAYSANGNAVYKIYIKASPSKAGTLKGSVIVTDKTDTYTVALAGECVEAKDNQHAFVSYKLSGHSKAETEGAVLALDELWKGMELSGYQTPTEMNIQGGALEKVKFQRNTIQGGVWPKGELDVVYTRYLQFGLKVAQGTELYLDSIGFYAGGGARYRVVCSQNEDFANAVTLGEGKEGLVNAVVVNSFKTSQKIESGKTFYVRIYPWNDSTTSEPSLSLSGFILHGITRTVGNQADKVM